jgi:enamine deaminase RidA (YjgF/YER057c/UK114 family)
MREAGGDLQSVVNLLQCFQGRGQTAAYVEERPPHFPKGVPTSTGTGATCLATPGALIQLDAVGALSRSAEQIDYLGGSSALAKYTNAIRFQDLVFMSGIMTNTPETQPDPQRWFGSALKLELKQIIEEKLAAVLSGADCQRSDIAVAHFHLLNPRDDYGALCEAIDDYFPKGKPVFMVSPSSGLGSIPGRIEITPIAVRGGSKLKVANVDVPALGLGLLGGPLAKRMGDFVYIGTQHASDGMGHVAVQDARAAHLVSDTALEMEEVISRMSSICSAAGGRVNDLMRLRLYVADVRNVAAAVGVVRRRIGDDVPVSIVEDAESAGWLGGSTISADAVLYAPQRN